MSNVNAESIRWAYRLLLDREPEDENVVKRSFPNIPALRDAILGSLEYRIKNTGVQLAPDIWVIKETIHGFRIWLSLAEHAVSRPILHDAYDAREVEILKTIVKKGDTVFDIGTNIGFYSNLFSKLVGPTGHVVGFEPLRYLYDKATASVRENKFQDFCVVHNLALSKTEGMINIRHAPITKNFGGGHIAPDSNAPKDHVDEKVNVSKLDKFLPQSTVKLIKIDVEGAEPMVIEGGRKLLARDRPTILAELHNAQLKLVSNSNGSQLIQQMKSLGYLCFAVGDTDRSQPMESYDSSHSVNVLFVSKA
jgi:FkbM family methyltransferase